MLTKQDAYQDVLKILPSVMVIIDVATIEIPQLGWIFYFRPKKYVKTGLDWFMGPPYSCQCFYNKLTQEIVLLDVFKKTELFLKEYIEENGYSEVDLDSIDFSIKWIPPKLSPFMKRIVIFFDFIVNFMRRSKWDEKGGGKVLYAEGSGK